VDTSFNSVQQAQNVLNYTHSQNIPQVNLHHPLQESSNISELMKYEDPNQCQDYREYLHPMGHPDEEMHNNIYEDHDLLLKDDDELSYRNTNIFNFDEYFTV
jgi:hypothetical protein